MRARRSPIPTRAWPTSRSAGRWEHRRHAAPPRTHVLRDSRVQLVGSADRSVAGDDDVDVVRHALEQPQCGEVVLDRVRGLQVDRCPYPGSHGIQPVMRLGLTTKIAKDTKI